MYFPAILRRNINNREILRTMYETYVFFVFDTERIEWKVRIGKNEIIRIPAATRARVWSGISTRETSKPLTHDAYLVSPPDIYLETSRLSI